MDRAPFKHIAGPYPGLRAFRRDEAPIFFGREEHVDALLERLHAHRFVAVVGASGAGKSSLVKAGLIPALQAGLLGQAGGKWLIAEMRPSEHPLARLSHAVAQALEPHLGQQTRQGFGEFVAGELARGRFGLRNVVETAALPPHTNLLVLADQFEEIFRFRSETDTEEADAFVNLLLEASRQTEVPISVVITMRSDFLGECAQFDGLPEAISESQYLTPRLTREQLAEAIAKPALLFGGEIEPALVNALINEVGRDQDQLPLLQHALMRMWLHARERTPANKSVTVTAAADHAAVGGVAGALSAHAQSIYEALMPDQQRLAGLLFRCLTNAGPGKRDTRRPTKLGEIAAAVGCPWEDLVPIVAAFGAPGCHFLVPGSASELAPDRTVDISHESFIRNWAKLRDEWLPEEQQAAENYRELARRSLNWRKKEGSELSELDLDRVEKWWNTHRPTAQWARRYAADGKRHEQEFAEVKRFLAQSRLTVQEERRRRQREAEEKEVQRQRELEQAQKLAEEAEGRRAAEAQKASEAEARRRAEEQRALDAEAHSRSQERARKRLTALAAALLVLLASAIYFAIQASKEKRRAEEQTQNALSRQFAAQSTANVADRLDLALLLARLAHATQPTLEARSAVLAALQFSPKLERYLRGHQGPVATVAFSPDGKRLASASYDNTVILWDVERRAMLGAPLQGHKDGVSHVAFSPDGKRLASASDDNTVILWNVDEQSWLERICYLAGRDITREEWQRYAGDTAPYSKVCPQY